MMHWGQLDYADQPNNQARLDKTLDKTDSNANMLTITVDKSVNGRFYSESHLTGSASPAASEFPSKEKVKQSNSAPILRSSNIVQRDARRRSNSSGDLPSTVVAKMLRTVDEAAALFLQKKNCII